MKHLNRYARKKKHKHNIQKRYARQYNRENIKLLADEHRRDRVDWRYGRNGGWEYWGIYYLTGARQYAKKFSDKRIRQKYRLLVKKQDEEDVVAPHGADYEKEFDYAWTVW